ncbi:MAG: MCP four helix bundle domain-containing protein, partial [Pararheinheimera sp.]|nr:MCP four helix bundle domain-containing protein [Rheinheimera sp.]
MLNQMSVKIRLLLLVCVPLLVLISISLISVREMGHLSDGATSIYADRVVPLKQIKQVADSYAVTSVDLLHKYRGELISASDAVQQLQQQGQLADQVWQAYLATTLTTEEAGLAEKAKQQMSVFRQKLQEYQGQISDGSLMQRSAKDFNTELYQLADPLSASLAALIDVQLVEAEKFKVEAAVQYQFFMKLFVIA